MRYCGHFLIKAEGGAKNYERDHPLPLAWRPFTVVFLQRKGYIWYVRHTLVARSGLRNVGGVKSQTFLKHCNHWKRALKMIFQGSGCLQFPKAVVTSTAKNALPKVVHYKFSLFMSRKCLVESAVFNCNKHL